ncbi:MAG: NAD(P)-binding protein, partial [Myxococcota bacterium]|nr:NAD(P)-binding protein [Myxococcota bacterium]
MPKTPHSQPPRMVIVGAGPTGLGAALRCTQLGHADWTVLERGSVVGGLARTEVDENGFLWDMGGHVVFSHYRYFDDLLDHCVPEW